MPSLSVEHKAALAEGRQQSRSVRRYLEALETVKPKRGRKRTPDSIRKRLSAIEKSVDEAAPLDRLQMIQERMDLSTELANREDALDLTAVEGAFVEAAAGYAERKGISYGAWRESGVPAEVLRRAGISR
ncbi:MAG: hypothetical protein WAS51_10270 [Ilumatobacteraceae bacterium]